MPPSFYGAVTYVFEGGRLVVVRVEQTLKPASVAREMPRGILTTA